MQPLVSQMESMWMSINRVENGREWDVCACAQACMYVLEVSGGQQEEE